MSRLGWRARAGLLLAASLLATGTAQGWNQAAGDVGRTGLADLPPGPWDIVATYDVLPENEAFHAIVPTSMIPTPYGPTGVSRNIEKDANGNILTDACTIVRITDVLTGTVARTPIPEARGCWTVGYSAKHDLYIICRGDTIQRTDMRAFHGSTLTEVWRVTAADVGLGQAQSPDDPVLGSDVNGACTGPAIDEVRDRIVAPWVATRAAADLVGHRISSIDLATGAVQWSTTVPTWVIGRQPETALPCSIPAQVSACASESGANWAPLMVTLTTSGIFVSGVSICADVLVCDALDGGAFTPFRQAVAWLIEGGAPAVGIPRGFYWQGNAVDQADAQLDGRQACTLCPLGSLWGTADGSIAYVLMGQEILAIDPIGDIVRRMPFEWPGLGQGHFGVAAPTVVDDSLLIAVGSRISAVDAQTGAVVWVWPGFGTEWTIGSFARAATSAGEFLVPAHEILGDSGTFIPPLYEVLPAQVRHLVFDAASGRLVQILPGAGELFATDEPLFGADAAGQHVTPTVLWGTDPAFVPFGSGFLLAYAGGRVSVFLPSDSAHAPNLRINTLFPALEREVQVTLNRHDHPNATRVMVNWGDDAELPVDWNLTADNIAIVHRYPDARKADVLVTVQQADNTTRTREIQLVVGGMPAAGPGDRMKAPQASTPYPLPDTPVVVNLVRPSGDVVELVANWGDATNENVPWESGNLSLNHAYTLRGERDATFTAVFLDGSTATRTVAFDVGGAPPEPLTFLQRRFSPENQNLTFFIIGLTVTLLGAAIAAASRTRQRSRIRSELRHIAAIQEQAQADPEGALRELGTLRQEMTDRLLAGRLNESQMQLLEDRIRGVVARIQSRVLEPLIGKASPQLLSLAALALRDNTLEPAEHASLLNALDADRGLSKADRQKFRMLMDAASRRGA